MDNILFLTSSRHAGVVDALPTLPSVYKWSTLLYDGELAFSALSAEWFARPPAAVVSYGDHSAWTALGTCYEVRRRWRHFDEGGLPVSLDITPTVFGTIFPPTDRPVVVSAFTSTFCSGDKLERPLRSLLAQSHRDWEWIIWDDSPAERDGGDTYRRLLAMARQDLRIRVFRAPAHSGSIGQLKRRAACSAAGDLLVELDHDDDLHPELFAWLRDAAAAHPDADFFYTDACELGEKTFAPFSYGDFFGFGFSGHYLTWSPVHDRYVVAATAPPPNGTTLRHIVGVPNHVRAWRSTAYDRIGKHNPLLGVADDYELLLRSFLDGGKWCHIRACGYYQYRNQDGNFTFIRNGLIQHNVAWIRRHYDDRLPAAVPGAGTVPQWHADAIAYPATARAHVTYDPCPWRDTLVFVQPADAAVVATGLPDEYDPSLQVVIMGVDTSAFGAFVDAVITAGASPRWRPNIVGWRLDPGSAEASAITANLDRYARVYLTWSALE